MMGRRATAVLALLGIVEGSFGTDNVREGKERYLHDGADRYAANREYEEGSCGFPQWEMIGPGSGMPDRALAAGHDTKICDGTVCGKDLYVSMIEINGGVALGKTWFKRDDACASVAYAGQGVTGEASCHVLTMGSATHGAARFAWAKAEAAGNRANRVEAPKNAIVAGNDLDGNGPLYVCRFADETGDFLVGQTWFPRHDEACCSAEYGGGVVRGEHCEILTKEPC
eukprot:CAMPEP_0172581450 /NCGR_PEP_ID=MMETSP1068-20121228/660_1 /TAXON_ID=35684 /ORGANISM="Pseudopedinella elastica, Strain CCMP716" /LENGTH=226 /DNA_ID=CAMNT_0013374425 /DNA_START=38 /DNA_END=718 /DNA_ORIENTATION=-